MRILYIDPVGADAFDHGLYDALLAAKRPDTSLDLVALPAGRPRHLEYHSYEALIIPDITHIVLQEAPHYDALVIGCFYDVGLREAREVSGRTPVTAPCQATTSIAATLGNSFSVLVTRSKCIPKMRENIHLYGHGERLASMRALELGVRELQVDHERTKARMLQEGRAAIEQDGAETLILGCTVEYGFYPTMQEELGVPVFDAAVAPLKQAEFLAETAARFGWHPSRVGGSEAPPEEEMEAWGIYAGAAPIGIRLSEEERLLA